MPLHAVALVLLSAATHLYWNYHIKRSPAPVLYSWWIQALGAVMFMPVGLATAWPPRVPPVGWLCVAGVGLFYGAYYTCVAWSYHRDDLSRAYPIARGIAPAATVLWGILFHGEHPSLPGALGVAGICVGVLLVARPVGGGRLPLAGVLAAVATGLLSSGYSALDKEGVQHVPVVLYLSLTMGTGALVQAVLLRADRHRAELAAELRRGGLPLWLSALAASGGYLLVLHVMRTQPVSYVVPVRSVSVLFSVLIGRQLLSEEAGPARLLAAGLIVAGISAIALGG